MHPVGRIVLGAFAGFWRLVGPHWTAINRP
jgi:hypothetical protein